MPALNMYCQQLAEHARDAPDRTFLIEEGQALSYRQVHERVEGLALRFYQHGLQPGARCILWMENGLDYALAWLALARLGAVSVPLNQAYHGPILAHQINDVQAQAVITDSVYWPHIAALGDTIPVFQAIFNIDRNDSDALPRAAIDLWVDGECHLNDPSLPQIAVASDCMSIFYTSGTTGPSKGVIYTHMQAWNTAQSVSPYLSAQDRFYMTNPMCHVGLPHCMGAVLQAGASLVVRKRFSASAFWPDVRRYGITTTMMLGSVASFLNAAPSCPDDSEHTLSKVLMVPVLKDAHAFCKRFGVAVMSWFNMTELSVPLHTDGFSAHPDGSCGQARAGVDARVVDDRDEEVPSGTPGELVVRDSRPWTISPGYLNRPDATLDTWRNLWFHTGDLCVRNEAGAFFFVDRLKDSIRRRGENISSYEVESQILLHPAVQEAAVIGVPATDGEQEVQAVVVLRDDARLTSLELLDFLHERLPHFCLPRYIAFNDEPLPKTGTGKVRKTALRTRYEQGQGDREELGYVLKKKT